MRINYFMKKLFICTNINQLLSFHINFSQYNKEIYVCIINDLVKNNKTSAQIMNFAKKFNYKYLKNLDEINNFGNNFDLISRRDISIEEIKFLKKFTIYNWYIVEDGLVDYINKINNKSYYCSLLYIIIRLYEKTISFLGNIYYLIFYNINRTFSYKNKIVTNLICSKKTNKEIYNKVFSNLLNNHTYKKFKIIIIGSLYKNYSDDYNKIYDYMMFLSKKRSIEPNEILYIPHPRMEIGSINKIKKKYSWEIDNTHLPAESIILNYKSAEVWSTFSSSIIYLKFFLGCNFTLFNLLRFEDHSNLKNYLKSNSIFCYFRSIGCKIIKII